MPRRLDRREFGFILFKERMMVRHRKFDSEDFLTAFLAANGPSDVYASAAYYLNPELEMDRKGWLGADLIFDVDADHVETPCKRLHDRWKCSDCGRVDFGAAPRACSKCGGQRLEQHREICEQCLQAAKAETRKLIDILMEDFGFDEMEMEVHFTGNRGYHTLIVSDRVHSLDQLARKEIVDYVCATGLRPELHNLTRGNRLRWELDHSASFGWSSRIARALEHFMLTADRSELSRIGISKAAIEEIMKKRRDLAAHPEKIDWRYVSGIGEKTWERIVQRAARLESSQIDTVVTTDVHRLVRLPGSLHGKTALKVQTLSIDELEDFDPRCDSVAFQDGEVALYVEQAERFRLGMGDYGPFRQESVVLPDAAAMFLLCQGKARVIGD